MTQKRWGATPEEWAIFTDKLDLTEDLLPVVSNPRAEISKKSTMKDIGKTPSQYDQFGHVTGIGKWTARISEPKRVASWGHEPDYGICVQTRHVRAIDIDIEDTREAQDVLDHVEYLLGFALPKRFRKGSSKCLLAVRVAGEFAKRVIHTDHGMVEFLANGQQFIAAGTHPKGARYEWAWPGGAVDIPTITKEQWDRVFDGVFEFYGNSKTEGGRLRKHSDGEQEVVSDRVSEWLGDQGLVIDYGSEGECYIECPFSDQHTSESGITATAYFPAGSRGYEQGHFKCMHAHCDGRNDLEFEGALGYSAAQFDDLPAETVKGVEKKPMPPLKRNKNGEPEAVLENIVDMLDRPDLCGVTIRFDEFTGDVIYRDEDTGAWSKIDDNFVTNMRILFGRKFMFLPVGRENMRDAINTYAAQNKVDTAIEWLEAQKWDGVPRIGTFVPDYFGTEDTEYARAISLYLWTSMAGRVLEPSVQADMMLVLKSPEGYRKTTAIRALAPATDQFCEIDFNDNDADNARKLRGTLVAECAELRGLQTKDIQSIIAFISRRAEVWVPKYREHATTYKRRTVFIGTTNEDELFPAERDNRRFLPIEVVDEANIDAIERDRTQLWAEAREMFKREGVMWEEAERLGHEEVKKFTKHLSWEEPISRWLNSVDELSGGKPCERDFISTEEILREALFIDIKKVSKRDEMDITKCMKILGYRKERRREDGVQRRGWVCVV